MATIEDLIGMKNDLNYLLYPDNILIGMAIENMEVIKEWSEKYGN